MPLPTLFISLVLPGQAAADRAEFWTRAAGESRTAVFSDAALKDVDRRVVCWAMASRPDVALLHGRFPIDSDRHVARPVRFLCTLSDPEKDIEKALRSWGGKRDLSGVDPRAVLDDSSAQSLINRQTQRLAGKHPGVGPDDPALLDKALANLRSKFAWIGTHECSPVDFEQLEHRGNVELGDDGAAHARDGGRFDPLIGLDLELYRRVAASAAE